MYTVKFQSFFNQINNSQLFKLKLELYNAAVKYHIYRTNWYFSEKEGRIKMDDSRIIAHNTFIDCCNILSRNMIKNAEEAIWRKELGDNRKTIGDFACFISYKIGLVAR